MTATVSAPVSAINKTSTAAGIEVDGVSFPPSSHAPGSTSAFFLAGAGVRGLEIKGEFVKFTAIAVYLEETTSLSSLEARWKGKTADELSGSVEFYRDVVTGPFEKFIRVTMILPLTGAQYSEKVIENCLNIWKSVGIYTEREGEAAEKFRKIFEDQMFPPGSSILFTQSPAGKLTIAFSKGDLVPVVNGVIENRAISEAILASIIGANGVSPAAKRDLAEHVAAMLNRCDGDVRGESDEAAKLDGSVVDGGEDKGEKVGNGAVADDGRTKVANGAAVVDAADGSQK